MKATFIKTFEEGFRGEARLFQTDFPVVWEDWEDGDDENRLVKHETFFVVVSATRPLFSNAETFIFPADETGKVLSWLELPGSITGVWDHEAALDRLMEIISSKDLDETSETV